MDDKRTPFLTPEGAIRWAADVQSRAPAAISGIYNIDGGGSSGLDPSERLAEAGFVWNRARRGAGDYWDSLLAAYSPTDRRAACGRLAMRLGRDDRWSELPGMWLLDQAMLWAGGAQASGRTRQDWAGALSNFSRAKQQRLGARELNPQLDLWFEWGEAGVAAELRDAGFIP